MNKEMSLISYVIVMLIALIGFVLILTLLIEYTTSDGFTYTAKVPCYDRYGNEIIGEKCIDRGLFTCGIISKKLDMVDGCGK